MDKTMETTLVAGIKDFFYAGNIDNPSLMKEYKALTPADKEEIREGLIRNGYKIKPVAHVAA